MLIKILIEFPAHCAGNLISEFSLYCKQFWFKSKRDFGTEFLNTKIPTEKCYYCSPLREIQNCLIHYK